MPYTTATLAYPVLVAITVWIKNLTGSFHVTLLNNIFVNGFLLTFALFLGEKAQMHLINLTQFPIIFLFYRYGSWRSIVAHIVLVMTGIIAILASYRMTTPWFPLPDDLAEYPGYLCWIAAYAMLIWYSVYSWKQVHLTEVLLAAERDQTKELLNETIPKLEKAEEKYRHLVDDSSELIFQLNNKGEILNINKAAQRILGFTPEDMVSHPLREYLAADSASGAATGSAELESALRQVLAGKKVPGFRLRLRHKHRPDGIELVMHLKAARFSGGNEIMGHASELQHAAIAGIVDEERGKYTLENSILHADILADRVSQQISAHFPLSELIAIRTCFREILINAIEHGNLGITFEEKTRVMKNTDFMEYLFERQRDTRFAQRRVRVTCELTPADLKITVSDDGEGFDHANFIKRTTSDDSLLYLEHGRGITMARNAFDTLVYNDRGNEVTLIKKRQSPRVP